MNPKKTQPESYTARFDSLVNEMMVNAVTKSEVKQVIDTFIAKFKEISMLLAEKMAENKAEMSTETARLGKQVADFEQRIRDMVSQNGKTLTSDFDTKLKELSALVGYIEQRIDDEKYDDTEMHTKMETVHREIMEAMPKMPKEFDPTEIMEDIDELEKAIEALKKRPMGTSVGRVTDIAVQQALMRTVKAETPSGTIDGANDTFTVSSTIHTVLCFELGSRVVSLGTYTITGGYRKTIVFDDPIPVNYSNDSFIITYI
jgi:phage host-nuclease inhibitor protein Gam